MVHLHACIRILMLTKDSMHGQSINHSFHYILFCLGDAESVGGAIIYHCIIKQLVSEWIGFVGGVSEKGRLNSRSCKCLVLCVYI